MLQIECKYLPSFCPKHHLLTQAVCFPHSMNKVKTTVLPSVISKWNANKPEVDEQIQSFIIFSYSLCHTFDLDDSLTSHFMSGTTNAQDMIQK